MALKAAELAKLEADFASGRNPLAYIPLCQALRRQRRYTEALEACQRGLRSDPNSVAGRTMLARLLADLGRYEESLREIERAGTTAPDAMGLLVEKARCHIRLHQENEAETVIRRLNGRNPMDPQVQLLNSQLRTLRNAAQARTSEVSRKLGLVPPALEAVLAAIHAQIDPLGRVLGIALLDLDSGRSCIEGEEGMAEAGQVLYEKAAQACDELDQGGVQYVVIELQKALVTTYLRGRHLLILGVDPAVNFGKLHHRIQIVLKQQIPVAEPVGPDSAEADPEE